MRPLSQIAVCGPLWGMLGGCSAPRLVDAGPGGFPPPVVQQAPNPLLVQTPNRDVMWEEIVDVVDNYFRIEQETRVRAVGETLTEGRIDTFPIVGATVLEPWRRDSVGGYNQWESTMQSIRRYAIARVTPAAGGYLVDVQVHKELEDVPRPERATAGAATFRNDTAIDDQNDRDPVNDPTNAGWIPVGRDAALEQEILGEIQRRLCQKQPGMMADGP